MPTKTKQKFFCETHGEYFQSLQQRKRGQSCPSCGKSKAISSKTKSWETFVLDARRIHGQRYTYPAQKYSNTHTKIKIICSIHGEFLQRPKNHLQGQHCPRCRTYKHLWGGCGELSKDHWSSIVRGAKSRKLKFEIDIEYAWKLFVDQQKLCALTNWPLVMHIPATNVNGVRKHATWTASLDRIDNTKGYEIGNVQWVHKDVQQLKWTFNASRLLELCKAILETGDRKGNGKAQKNATR
jgi:Zn finger protein HypA/HybF involved in hydrogenase expression